jgi:hypothetical protein
LNFITLNPQGGTIVDRLNPLNWTHNSLHPNARGHEAMADAARRWFEEHPSLASTSDTSDVEPVPSLRELMDGRAVVQCGDYPECRVTGGRWVSAQAHRLYERAIVPVAVATVGLWLLVLPVLWFARRRGWSVERAAASAGWTDAPGA